MVPGSNLSADCRRTRWPSRDVSFATIHGVSSGSGLGWILDAYGRGCIAGRAAWLRAETVNAGEGC